MHFDAVTLARIQFAITIMFHYIFPPLSIGLGVIMVVMEGMFLKTRNPQYESMARFWTKIFALNFAIGVATGVVMEFQFGTNWAMYSRFVGDVFGSALAAEGIFAFFLESGFLSILVFGWDRVSPKMHFFSTLMVSLGSIFSAIWIVVANSWQQTPSGFHIVSGHAEITDFWAMVFNPSSGDRLLHVIFGALILGGFFVMSVAAYYLLKKRHLDFAQKCFRIALIVATIASVLQLLSGHHQARIVAEHQPAKLAAFEGHFKTAEAGTALYLWGIPDSKTETVHLGVSIPGLLSFLVYTDFKKPVRALDTFKPEDRPPVGITFQTYHLMIALGMYFIALTLLGSFLLWRGTLFQNRRMLIAFVFSVIGPFIANEVGWVAAEVGRQPWSVYGLLRTSDSVSRVVAADQIGGSIAMFSVLYALLFAIWIYVLNDKIQHGPEPAGPLPAKTSAEGLFEGASRLQEHSGHSLTDEL